MSTWAKADKILVRDELQPQNLAPSPNFSKAREHLGLELMFSLLETQDLIKTCYLLLWFLVPNSNTCNERMALPTSSLSPHMSSHVLTDLLELVLCLGKLCRHFSPLPGIFIPVCLHNSLGVYMFVYGTGTTLC